MKPALDTGFPRPRNAALLWNKGWRALKALQQSRQSTENPDVGDQGGLAQALKSGEGRSHPFICDQHHICTPGTGWPQCMSPPSPGQHRADEMGI